MQSPGFFIGHLELTEMLKQFEPGEGMLYLSATYRNISGGEHNLGRRDYVVMVQAIEDDLVHYCQIPVGRMQTMSGQPFDPQNELVYRKRALGAFEVVRSWLEGGGWYVINAQVSMPQPERMTQVGGDAAVLGYDPEEKAYYRIKEKTKHGKR